MIMSLFILLLSLAATPGDTRVKTKIVSTYRATCSNGAEYSIAVDKRLHSVPRVQLVANGRVISKGDFSHIDDALRLMVETRTLNISCLPGSAFFTVLFTKLNGESVGLHKLAFVVEDENVKNVAVAPASAAD